MFKNLPIFTASLLIVSFSSNSAEALTLVANRTNINSNEQIDWSSKFTTPPFSTVGYDFTATSPDNFGINVSIPPATSTGITPPFVFQTNTTVPTNFANGDFVLFTGFNPGTGVPAVGNPGPITITFSTNIAAVGTQIATDDALQPYKATIEAYDSTQTLLGSFTIDATSSTALDNTAAFLGVKSDSFNIASIKLYTSLNTQAVAINKLSIEAIPEPSIILGSLLAMSGLEVGFKRKLGLRKTCSV